MKKDKKKIVFTEEQYEALNTVYDLLINLEEKNFSFALSSKIYTKEDIAPVKAIIEKLYCFTKYEEK